jgi:hypothetical protein
VWCEHSAARTRRSLDHRLLVSLPEGRSQACTFRATSWIKRFQ